MVTRYGMSSLVGTINYGSDEGQVFLGRDFAKHENISEETSALIDREIKKLIDEAYHNAVEILNNNRNKLERLAQVLIEKEKIETDEFEQIMNEN